MVARGMKLRYKEEQGFFFFNLKKFFLKFYGCVGSSFLCEGFL